MRSYDPDQPLYSLHIPKTGGSSLRHLLGEWFPHGRMIGHYRQPDGRHPLRHELKGQVCIHGHFNAARGFGITKYYPQADQFITFLRDPFERFLSEWFFMNRRKREGNRVGHLDGDIDFETFLHRCVEAERQKRNHFSIMWHFPDVPDHTHIADLMDRQFVFVGIMERYQASLDALGTALCKPPAQVVHHNGTERDGADLSMWRPFYETHFAPEFEIYEAGLARNSELIRRYPPTRRIFRMPAAIGRAGMRKLFRFGS